MSLFSVLSQFAGAFNAFKLDWIPIAPDLKPWAAGLSTLIAIGGFLIAWATAPAPGNHGRRGTIARRIWFGVGSAIASLIAYWILNQIYTADAPLLAQLGFLILYSAIFGFLSYSVVVVATEEAEE